MCVEFIRKTSVSLKLPIRVIQMDVIKYLSSVKKSFDLIFADPPYNIETEQYTQIVKSVFSNQLLNNQGVLIIEHSEREDLEKNFGFVQSRKYGSNVFSFFKG